MSIRQPLVLYATIFMLLLAAFAVTASGFSLTKASRRAYRRAVVAELRALASSGDLARVRTELEHRPRNTEIDVVVVTASISGVGIDLAAARDAHDRPELAKRLVSVRLESADEEAYLVAYTDAAIPAAIGLSELARLIPVVLLAALATAGVLAVMMRRLLIPSIASLAEVARDPMLRADGLVTDAPNEILDVAQTFRRTVRQLHEERELIEAKNRELASMQTSLIRASKLASVGRLAAGIAHEIGNPLAAVQGYLSLLPRLDESERKEVVERSSRELKRIHETIKKLLTYARQEEPSTPAGPISIAQVLHDAILLVRGHPAFHGVEIEYQGKAANAGIEAREEREALGDAGRLGQVFVNLLLNAAQAMAELDEKRIRITRTITDDAVELAVIDSGPGVPDDKHELVFDPFYTTKAPGEGTGLGLAVSRSLVEAMGGELTLASTVGAGACFTVRLRRA